MKIKMIMSMMMILMKTNDANVGAGDIAAPTAAVDDNDSEDENQTECSKYAS